MAHGYARTLAQIGKENRLDRLDYKPLICYDPYPYHTVWGRSSDWVIVAMCVEGTKVKLNVI